MYDKIGVVVDMAPDVILESDLRSSRAYCGKCRVRRAFLSLRHTVGFGSQNKPVQLDEELHICDMATASRVRDLESHPSFAASRCSVDRTFEHVNPLDHIKLNTKYTTQGSFVTQPAVVRRVKVH